MEIDCDYEIDSDVYSPVLLFRKRNSGYNANELNIDCLALALYSKLRLRGIPEREFAGVVGLHRDVSRGSALDTALCWPAGADLLSCRIANHGVCCLEHGSQYEVARYEFGQRCPWSPLCFTVSSYTMAVDLLPGVIPMSFSAA